MNNSSDVTSPEGVGQVGTTTVDTEGVDVNLDEVGDIEFTLAEEEASALDLPLPDLARPLPAGTSQKTQDAVQEIIDRLKVDPGNSSNWNSLGQYRKSAGDYVGAEEAWLFARILAPARSVIDGNLGVLYANYLDKPEKSEEFFLSAIEKAPHNTYLYYQLFEFYRDVLNEPERIEPVITTALGKFPGNTDLIKLQTLSNSE